MGISIDIATDTGLLDSIIARLPGVDDIIGDLGSEAIEQEAKARAAVDTGYMRDSIFRSSAGGGTWWVYSPAYYSGFVEFGTRYMAAQPFMIPAANSVNWISIIKMAFSRSGYDDRRNRRRKNIGQRLSGSNQ